jgi:hypothetical protein
MIPRFGQTPESATAIVPARFWTARPGRVTPTDVTFLAATGPAVGTSHSTRHPIMNGG